MPEKKMNAVALNESQKSESTAQSGILYRTPDYQNANYREIFQRIQRRSGEIVDFDKSRITEAIWKAMQNVGETPRSVAELISDKVILHLSRTHDDHLLTIEEVQDAVEEVLIKNGYSRVAKAYILYRQERARVRRFRETGRLVQPPDILPKVSEQDVEVLTSAEQLVHWNRDRITEALIRETGLSPLHAEQISREVEKQIIYSKTSRLTAPLIRELVNVKLLEYGFARESHLHSRLGMPLYDIEQLLHGHSSTGESLEQALCGSIMRQYMLSCVHSPEVAEAHLRGDLMLHGLSEPWRQAESIQSLEYLKKTGLCFPDFTSRWPSAESAFELISQLGKFNRLLEQSVHRRSMWDGVNVFLAPYLEDRNADQMKTVAQALLHEMAVLPSERLRLGLIHSLGFYFHIPQTLWETAAMGPGGRYTGKTYAYYEETSRAFLQVLLEVAAEGQSGGLPWLGPEFCFHFDRQFFESPDRTADLERLERCLPRLGRWCAWMHSRQPRPGRLEHFCQPMGGQSTQPAWKYPWKMRSSVAETITINLPGLMDQTEGDVKELYSLLEQQIYLCFTAFRERREFLEQIHSQGVDAPVTVLEHRGDGEPFHTPLQSYARISLWGLESLATQFTQDADSADMAYQHLITQLLRTLAQKVRLSSQSSRIPCEVVLETDPAIGEKMTRRSQAISPLVECDHQAGTKMDPLRAGQWGVLLSGTSEQQLSPQDLAGVNGGLPLSDLFLKIYEQDREERLVVAQPLWICRTCSRLLQGNPDICPQCGSLQLKAVKV